MSTLPTLFMSIAHWAGLIVGGVGLLATLLPLLKQTWWWIRVCDFPRLQIVVGLALSLGLTLAADLHERPGPWGEVFAWALGVGLVYQAFRIWPYTPLHRKQVANSTRDRADGDHHVSLVVTNVLMYNRDASRCLGVLQQCDPDIILAVETDEWWLSQLKRLEKTHPYTAYAPLPNTYGMLLFSRLPLLNPQIRYIIDPAIPSFHGCVVLPSGVQVALHCLHPKPPAPQESKSSSRRDAELLVVGRIIQRHNGPTIVAGDLNDVAWSHTSELFRRLSRLLDPRIGRGLLPTFHADHKLLRWPLDHVFHSSHFKVARIERLPHIGSDHYPIYIRLSYEPQDWHLQEQELEQPDEDDHEEAAEKIQEGVEDMANGDD